MVLNGQNLLPSAAKALSCASSIGAVRERSGLVSRFRFPNPSSESPAQGREAKIRNLVSGIWLPAPLARASFFDPVFLFPHPNRPPKASGSPAPRRSALFTPPRDLALPNSGFPIPKSHRTGFWNALTEIRTTYSQLVGAPRFRNPSLSVSIWNRESTTHGRRSTVSPLLVSAREHR